LSLGQLSSINKVAGQDKEPKAGDKAKRSCSFRKRFWPLV
jgi:hypothetical protein